MRQCSNTPIQSCRREIFIGSYHIKISYEKGGVEHRLTPFFNIISKSLKKLRFGYNPTLRMTGGGYMIEVPWLTGNGIFSISLRTYGEHSIAVRKHEFLVEGEHVDSA